LILAYPAVPATRTQPPKRTVRSTATSVLRKKIRRTPYAVRLTTLWKFMSFSFF